MDAHSDTSQDGENVTETEAQSDDNEEVYFEEISGLYTNADLGVSTGTSPVTVEVGGLDDDRVQMNVGLGAGDVTVNLTPQRALQLAEALEDAALAIHNRGDNDD